MNEIREEYDKYLKAPSNRYCPDRIFGSEVAEDGGNYHNAMGFYAGYSKCIKYREAIKMIGDLCDGNSITHYDIWQVAYNILHELYKEEE